MPFEILRNDITNMKVDAIVNTANPRPVIGSGVDAAIHAKAGPLLLEARKKIGVLDTGTACVTGGYRLPCRYVIHTVGPVWEDGSHGEALLLRQCYVRSLELALAHKCQSVAFPLISTGNYGFPKKLALQIAVETIREFLEEQEMQIYLVVFGRDTLELSGGLVDHVRSFIDEAYVQERQKAEYSFSVSRVFDFVRERLTEPEEKTEESSADEEAFDDDVYASAPMEMPSQREPAWEDISQGKTADEARRSAASPQECLPEVSRRIRPKREKKAPKKPFDPRELTRLVRAADAGFSETLLRLIDESGEKDSAVYKRANVERRLFSKIRNNPQYRPSKATAVAFAIALKLDLEETRDLIGRAGYALSRSNTFDIIIEYFITHERYDIYEINLTLFEFDQNLLGA